MTKKKKSKKKLNNRQHIMARYGCIVLLFLLGCVGIIAKLSVTTILEAKEWNARAAREMADTTIIYPTRGSILSSNGNILACNRTLYDARIDLRHPKFTKLKPKEWAAIDSLADSLDVYYPRVKGLDHPIDHNSEDSWRHLFHTQFEIQTLKERKSTATVGNKLTLEDYEKIRNFPFFKDIKSNGHKCPLYKEEHIIRVYPFGDMARLSIGRVYEEKKTGRIKGYAGLEMALDEALYGKPGRARKVALTNGLSDWVDVPPTRGFDILTTIDIDLQDILENELLNMCDSLNAYWGTAVLMEVATGEIKAISNVERDSTSGEYVEAMNRAVQAFEPGSVMKPISLMVAFEDSIIKSEYATEDCSPFMRTSDHAGGGVKTMKEIIETSSNTGIARVIFRKYASDPQGFRRRLAELGFFEPMNSGIGGETTPRVPDLVAYKNGKPITMTARHLDLARQAYGYNTAIPPLYTLAYYNAFANKGKMVRPHLVRALRNEDGHDSILPISYIRKQVCTPEHAKMISSCLYDVVWGKRGTGRALQDDRVVVCGKTGTAIPHIEGKGYDQSKRRYAFCGFFPYDNPKYSCIVLMMVDAHVASAARASGGVLLNTALRMHSRGLLNDISTSYTATKKASTAQLYGSETNATYNVKQALDIANARQLKVNKSASGTVPDVSGMDIASAVRTLENKGITVERINGNGFVTKQSLAAGTPLAKGQKCSLWMAWK
ncbi:MAG: penicillin-binding transpeptidase domain-containing protein [Lachnospiraceae bacterium]|nr:penicillin-binding transpeptidase domain-containing protein [Prevotella sp.]MCM1075045.1 penicillin-binding transpeptidase domain-containing protein [Ruminococcus sp.]MCM1225067.1 penicillin-binding transpeptidase domain-containing protein [Lachnospiraceae bacterium]